MERQIPTLEELRLLARNDVLLSHAFELFDYGDLPLRDMLLVLVKFQHDAIQELRDRLVDQLARGLCGPSTVVFECKDCPLNPADDRGPDPSGPSSAPPPA